MLVTWCVVGQEDSYCDCPEDYFGAICHYFKRKCSIFALYSFIKSS